MNADQLKTRRAVLGCFRHVAEFDEFLAIAAGGEFGALLRWLDESGIALYLGQRLGERGLLERIDPGLRCELERRLVANRQRTEILLADFERVNDALRRAGVQYAMVKGFTLAPEFCPARWLRHQSDIDLLMSPREAGKAVAALCSLGYEKEPYEGSGEICLAIRSDHVPSAEDFLYDLPKHRHVEIQTSLYESHCGVSLAVGSDWIGHIEEREVGGVRYPSLDLPYRLLLQVLHAFRHTSSWARLAWFYEIAYFVERFGNDDELWTKIDRRLPGAKERQACGVVCAMVADMFGAQFPTVVKERWITPLPDAQASWMEQRGELWLLSDFLSGSKAGLFLQRQFADSRWAWWWYRASRYVEAVRTLGHGDQTGTRAFRHRARKQIDYVWQSLRWSRE
jgi:hypothetical protein